MDWLIKYKYLLYKPLKQVTSSIRFAHDFSSLYAVKMQNRSCKLFKTWGCHVTPLFQTHETDVQTMWGSNVGSYGWLLLNEVWCETSHHITIHAWKWRVLWDCTSHNSTSMKGYARLHIKEQYIHEVQLETLHHRTIHSWRAAWDCTSKNHTFIKGGVRLYIT